jgi:arylsulfatase A-like enzyme
MITGKLAISLFVICAAAKLPVLINRDLAFSWWLMPALFWQDAMVALVGAAILFPFRKQQWVVWPAYAIAVVYLAINSVLMAVLSSPLTLAMARATGGALQDSIAAYLTPMNLAIIAGLLLLGFALPLVIPSLPFRWSAGLAAVATAVTIFGPFATAHSHTDGLHRNAYVAFARSLFPRIAARPAEKDWRASPFAIANGTDRSVRVTADGPDLWDYRAAAANRNVVLISLESTGAQYLAPWGATNDPMPNLSRLATSGILFESAYAGYPESIKGLLSTLCSVYPAIDLSTDVHASTETPSLAHVLAVAGYTNALFHSGRFMYLGMEVVVRNRGFHFLRDAAGISGNFNSSFGVDEPATIEKMLEWLDSLRYEQRFFLTYLPIAGHHPYDAPEVGPFPNATDHGRYLNALWYGDKALGHFLEELQARNLYTNTLFVIYGDHGEAFGQHAGNYGHTLNIYEENVRVPLLIAAPGLIDQPVRISRLASLVDVAPTTLDLLGLEAPIGSAGSSLLPVRQQMALFFTDYSLGLLGLRDGNWKFVHELESGRSKLFDLSRDHRETQNMAHHHLERIKAYREHLLNWASAQRFRVNAEHRRTRRGLFPSPERTITSAREELPSKLAWHGHRAYNRFPSGRLPPPCQRQIAGIHRGRVHLCRVVTCRISQRSARAARRASQSGRCSVRVGQRFGTGRAR